MYEELTVFLPFTDKKNAGQLILAIGEEKIIGRIRDAVYEFEKKHENLIPYDHEDILIRNGIRWDEASLCRADVSQTDGPVILAMLLGAVHNMPLGDKTLETLLDNGCLHSWLLRLKQIDIASIRWDILRITVSSCSGYVFPEYAYRDELSITKDGIAYEYEHYCPSEENPSRSWACQKTDSKLFGKLTKSVLIFMNDDENKSRVLIDAGVRSISVEYANGLTEERSFWEWPQKSRTFIEIIKQMLPPDKKIPVCIRDDEER